jgi:high-affinity K+ transport system ATPase subunit B
LGPLQLTPPHIALSIVAVSTAAVFIAVAYTVVYAQEWRSASVPPLSVLLRSALPLRVPIMLPAITALPLRAAAHTATTTTLPTTAAYLPQIRRHTASAVISTVI